MSPLAPIPIENDALQYQLNDLASYSNKKNGWVRADLSISRSSCPGRFLWKVIGLFSTTLQQRLYGVNLVQSQQRLQTIKPMCNF